MNLACILFGGSDHKIRLGGEIYIFEMHPYCGPIPLSKRGNPKQLGPKHLFWRAVTWWNESGRQVDEAGFCVWTEPPSIFENAVHIGGRHWMLLPPKVETDKLVDANHGLRGQVRAGRGKEKRGGE